jgi:hypothetical protein
MREWPQPNENKQQVAAVASTLFMTFVYISAHAAANFVQSLSCRSAGSNSHLPPAPLACPDLVEPGVAPKRLEG